MKELFKKRKGLLGNETGLTLIELLAVIVILAIISAIAIPAIGGIINDTKKKTHSANALLIIDAARYKVINEQPTDTATKYKLGDLADGGYLEDVPLDPKVKGKTYDPDDVVVAVKDTSTDGKYKFYVQLSKNDGIDNSVSAAAGDYYIGSTKTLAVAEETLKTDATTASTVTIPS